MYPMMASVSLNKILLLVVKRVETILKSMQCDEICIC